MTVTIKKLLVGATVAASMSAIASTPAFATNLTKPTNIQFTTNGVNNTDANKPNINTWTYGSAESDKTGIGGANRQVLNDYSNYGNTNKAIAALTDNDSATNVELFTDGEVVKDHVGFSANLGKNTIKVESVTKDDWADGTLATAWLKGFGNAYGGLMSSIPTIAGSNMLKDFNNNFDFLVTALKTNGFNSAGDANIGDIAYNKKTGELKVDLVGHLDVAGKYVDTRKTIVDTRKTIKDPQKTIVDTRATILDTQVTIKDTRATIIDTRATIIDTQKTIVVNGKTVSNPTYNKPIPNPTYNKSIPNPTYNKSIPNPTYNQQIANPTYNKDIPNPNYNKDIPNPTYNKDIPNPNYLGSSPDKTRNSTGNQIFDAMLFNLAKTAFLTNTPFQVSEIAKITFNDQVDYAFSFSATDSGAIAGDRNKTTDTTSHTGIYSWNKTYKTVPEPSAIFGLVAVGGLVVASRRKRVKNA
ncbi:PEP-CTERM sorting domain-containing protein [Hassallia byssoidea VB512170]|uniref:PEP-CTERM sorting domain-containing protein n=1 Tax=Hassallia byssoidea VB512170 TaxID=1304833 RepID=A0A846HF26_9CYAN|nr:NF038130 family PEP-CTERM protein [Hassalia byssoidea]NEU75926.1 PEP-CTERM sorting domain-containing protein [Hassalia byssoidea VB512170]